MNTSGKFAIADMENKSLTWVTGLPDASEMANYSNGYGDGYDGYYYLPIGPAESSSTGGHSARMNPSKLSTLLRNNSL